VVLWFVGLTVLGMWAVFNDPAIDYRFVAAGALLPDVADVADPWALPFHSVVIVAAVLGLVMVATVRRRATRRLLLPVPIGMFGHLVLDGVFGVTEVFWWPLSSDGMNRVIPSLDRGLTLVVVQELVGLVALLWGWRKFGLADATRRRALVENGRLSPA